MIVLLAAGVGVCVLGLLAIGFGIPISDSSFGNALLIAGVLILCTGVILIGMWLAVRELAKLIAAPTGYAARPAASQRAASANPFAATIGGPVTEAVPDRPNAPTAPPPWADEVATRARPRATAPEIPPVEPADAPPAPAPDRPARRNLLFATKRRDKADAEQPAATPPPPSALEAEPKVSFEDAWPNPSRSNGSAERNEPSVAPADMEAEGSDTARAATARSDTPAASETPTPRTDLPPGVTVVRSGTVDEMAYTYFSDGSIEAQLSGESPIRFASLDALRTYVEQRK